MKKRLTKRIFWILVCAAVCFAVLLALGGKYTVKLSLKGHDAGAWQVTADIDQDGEFVKLEDVRVSGADVYLSFSSLSRGKAFVSVSVPGETLGGFRLYVHSMGMITYDSFFGPSRGDIILPVCVCLWLLSVFTGILRRYRTDMNEDMYSYGNVTELGLMIFCGFLMANQLIYTLSYRGVYMLVRSVMEASSRFAVYVLPIAFVVWLLVSASNVRLLIKEGFTWHNMLGMIIGVLVCAGTLLPLIVGDLLQSVTWVDVHNEQGIALYIESFTEAGVFGVITYLECILLSTIILAVKAARHVPPFDRDYMLILGCQLNEDGSLTKLLSSRADRALEFGRMQKEKTGRTMKYVPTGGKGDDEVISEGEAIGRYLRSKGIEEENILVEDRAGNTLENMQYSMELIKADSEKDDPKIAFSTTNYHVFRSGLIASSLGIKAEGIGSPTKRYFWINAFIREYIATLYSERRTHLGVIAGLTLLNLAMAAVLYLSNVL